MFLWFSVLSPPKKLAISSVFSGRGEPPVHGHVVSAVTAALAAIVATLKAHPLQRTSFASRQVAKLMGEFVMFILFSFVL